MKLLFLNMDEKDRYKTVAGTAKGIYKEKGSKFIAIVSHVETEAEAKLHLAAVKREYHDARHHCYAWRINPENPISKSSDDGEPSGTAGKPILNQIFSKELHDVLVVVVRYFGGTKLGVSGLIRAYKTATHDALTQAKIVDGKFTRKLHLQFAYPLMNDVMRIVKDENLKVLNQDFGMDCKLDLEVDKSRKEIVFQRFKRIYEIKVSSC
jgi:uncharacterized YigZ family protein